MDQLALPQQQEILDFARRLTETTVFPGRDLSRFAGSIPEADLKEMTQAIAEGA